MANRDRTTGNSRRTATSGNSQRRAGPFEPAITPADRQHSPPDRLDRATADDRRAAVEITADAASVGTTDLQRTIDDPQLASLSRRVVNSARSWSRR